LDRTKEKETAKHDRQIDRQSYRRLVLKADKHTRVDRKTDGQTDKNAYLADKTKQGKQDKTRKDKTRQDKTRQDKTRQDKTRAGQDKTRQDKTRRDDKKSQDEMFITEQKQDS
jgi:hypothetical protein